MRLRHCYFDIHPLCHSFNGGLWRFFFRQSCRQANLLVSLCRRSFSSIPFRCFATLARLVTSFRLTPFGGWCRFRIRLVLPQRARTKEWSKDENAAVTDIPLPLTIDADGRRAEKSDTTKPMTASVTTPNQLLLRSSPASKSIRD